MPLWRDDLPTPFSRDSVTFCNKIATLEYSSTTKQMASNNCTRYREVPIFSEESCQISCQSDKSGCLRRPIDETYRHKKNQKILITKYVRKARYFLLVTFWSLIVAFCLLLTSVCPFPLSFWSFFLNFCCNCAFYAVINLKVVLLFCAFTIKATMLLWKTWQW